MTPYAGSLASLYARLAEALAPSPSPAVRGGGRSANWLAEPGRGWPLFSAASELAAARLSEGWTEAVIALVEVSAGSPQTRLAEYETLFLGPGSPSIWLYESQYLNGRIPGPATFTVQSLYREVGLETNSAELPDHASMELAFLAFLAQKESEHPQESGQWRRARKLFIQQHAGRWLPGVGRALTRSPYPAWIAIGHLLIASLEEKKRPRPAQSGDRLGLPQIPEVENCNLCGFCVQACPTHALYIHEDDQTTVLWLASSLCIGCDKCEKVCTEGALSMSGDALNEDLVSLRQSPRAICPLCGEATVSEAELEAVAAKIGHPPWLSHCLDCRAG